MPHAPARPAFGGNAATFGFPFTNTSSFSESFIPHLQRNAEEVEQWQRQHRIDNICLAERKWIYLKWQERKAFRSMQAQQQRPVQAQAKVVPSPVHPLTQTSIHGYQGVLNNTRIFISSGTVARSASKPIFSLGEPVPASKNEELLQRGGQNIASMSPTRKPFNFAVRATGSHASREEVDISAQSIRLLRLPFMPISGISRLSYLARSARRIQHNGLALTYLASGGAPWATQFLQDLGSDVELLAQVKVVQRLYGWHTILHSDR